MKGYRTLLFNGAAGGLLGLDMTLEAALGAVMLPEVQGVLPESWLPWYALIVALGNMWLRTKTDTPVGRKG
ncbi:hypothetical protein [Qingshengfaniella alkalisoli]|uniref:Uncharacterized protein n=1 Tax=Qingshengfaniella alkalisoli TaxID=2599296 RepID=A0A5B8IVJ2_9RHOB|nr:hypothetical protein [Qingshengfaniella alkalisoli]QDY70132.1 hypothetical protein FPZ52_11200 [Qingshengfaniella alkalisoli]